MKERVEKLEEVTSIMKDDLSEIKGGLKGIAKTLERAMSSHDDTIRLIAKCEAMERDIGDHKKQDDYRHKDIEAKLASINWKLAVYTGSIGVVVFMIDKVI